MDVVLFKQPVTSAMQLVIKKYGKSYNNIEIKLENSINSGYIYIWACGNTDFDPKPTGFQKPGFNRD